MSWVTWMSDRKAWDKAVADGLLVQVGPGLWRPLIGDEEPVPVKPTVCPCGIHRSDCEYHR